MVPSTFDELLRSLAGVPAFAVSFGLLASIWYAQYTYFRRYNFEDVWVVVLNVVLHVHAYRSRASLGLSHLEAYELKASILLYASTAAIGALSAVVVLPLPNQSSVAGFTYFLLAMPSVVAGTLVGRRRRRAARQRPA